MRHELLAREISYAGSARSRGGRALIRAMEAASGRHRLIRRARGYEADLAAGEDVWSVMARRYGLALEVTRGALETIPAQGSVIVVANHPYGILDGLMLGHLMSRRRGADFRILAHKVFGAAPEIARVVLPVDFDGSRAAAQKNLATRALALAHLGENGAVGIFPGGTVSTAAKPFGIPGDPVWRSFTAKMVARSDATVIPVYFEGANSRLFQVASHLHYTLRMGLMLREFGARTDTPVRVAIGDPVPRTALDARRDDPKALMDFLRKATYELSPTPRSTVMGHEFESRYRVRDGGRDFR
ncbi:lysophospholipid acyltransferase family protein [Limimaricola sp. AA108-03]|uniref:lysophospholipid acyltransferase family protein n=1 Tax=Limimaricola sp. AA108-03 TaxID=3425945 RepID=UPI003D76A445